MAAAKVKARMSPSELYVDKSKHTVDSPKVAIIGDGKYPNYFINRLLDRSVDVVALLTRTKPPGAIKGIDVIDIGEDQQHLAGVMNLLLERGVEYFLVAFYDKKIPEAVVDKYDGRLMNFHPSLLPLFRGGNPIEDMMNEGVKNAGVTIHRVDYGFDTGAVLAQRSFPIYQYCGSRGMAYKKAMREGASIFAYVLENMDEIEPVSQTKLLDNIMANMSLH